MESMRELNVLDVTGDSNSFSSISFCLPKLSASCEFAVWAKASMHPVPERIRESRKMMYVECILFKALIFFFLQRIEDFHDALKVFFIIKWYADFSLTF